MTENKPDPRRLPDMHAGMSARLVFRGNNGNRRTRYVTCEFNTDH